MKLKKLIIVPAFNEEASIVNTVKDIQEACPDMDIAVINDGSTDRTHELVDRLDVHVLSLPFNLGIGGAVQTGFKFAKTHDYDIAVQVDGDGQHDAKYVPTLVDPICAGRADMVIGSRFLPPQQGFKSSFVRRMGIQFFSVLLSILTQNKVTDPTSGFRAYNKNMIELFSKYYPSDFPEPEAIMVAQRYHLKIMEVPVSMRKRQGGASSIRYLKTLYYMIKVTLAILLHKLHRRGSQKGMGHG